MKPSGQPEVDRVPYAVETLLGWAVNNWLSGERRVASPYSEVQCDSKVTWYLPHRFSLTPRNLSVSEEYTMHRQSSWDKV